MERNPGAVKDNGAWLVPLITLTLSFLWFCWCKPGRRPRQTANASRKYRLFTKCTHNVNGRNLIVCIDGTANQFGEKNTNVIELYNLILKTRQSRQLTWYNSGIGTYVKDSWTSFDSYKQAIWHKVDLAIAWDFKKTVLGAYRWLSENYEEGDSIFLFGFSRGAFQVRVLSAMIHKVGLIHKGNEMQIPFAYELYADPASDEPATVTRVGDLGEELDRLSMAERFKRAFSYEDVNVHFVGAWDTVSSIGIAREQQLLPHTVDGMGHVCYFRHALALDERRVKFLPEYAYGGWSLDPEAEHTTNDEEAMDNGVSRSNGQSLDPNSRSEHGRDIPQLKEVWFAGTHSDIGGGNVQNVGMNRSRPPLRWMVLEAESVGLRTGGLPTKLNPRGFIEIRESLTWFWWLLEVWPFERLTFTRKENGRETTRMPHLGKSRKIHPGQKIHASLILGDTVKPYTPSARPPNDDPQFWTKLASSAGDWLEVDVDDFIRITVDNFIKSGDIAKLGFIGNLAKEGAVSEALSGVLSRILDAGEVDTKVRYQLLTFTLDFLKQRPSNQQRLHLAKLSSVHSLLSEMTERGFDYDQRIIREFIFKLTDRCMYTLETAAGLNHITLSPDGKHLIGGFGDGSIRMWSTANWALEGLLTGHKAGAVCLACSPDGKFLASGSLDHTVRVWDLEARKAVGEPLQGHSDTVWSIAFSPNGRHIASGSEDKTVRLWDVEKGEAVGNPLKGHDDAVYSVAFSPDGTLLASGSRDLTIRLWSIETGDPVGEPFRGHKSTVFSIAFSPDGKYIISGSGDMTLRLWDVKTGQQVGRPFEGHTEPIWDMALSPDGKRIVSGSDDMTVRIWDITTREGQGLPLIGHTGWVTSVAFSPDGKWVVSSGSDSTIRILHVED